MSISWTVTHNISLNTGTETLTGQKVLSETQEKQIEYSRTLAALTQTTQQFMGWQFGTVIAFAVDCDTNLTIKTNSNTVPDDTLTTTGGELYMFPDAGVSNNPFTANVDSLYITNDDATETATIKIYVLDNMV